MEAVHAVHADVLRILECIKLILDGLVEQVVNVKIDIFLLVLRRKPPTRAALTQLVGYLGAKC